STCGLCRTGELADHRLITFSQVEIRPTRFDDLGNIGKRLPQCGTDYDVLERVPIIENISERRPKSPSNGVIILVSTVNSRRFCTSLTGLNYCSGVVSCIDRSRDVIQPFGGCESILQNKMAS